MNEIWKDVVGYEGIYEVSNIGRVRTHKNKTTHSILHGKRKWQQRILKEKNKKGRDVRVSLWKDKSEKSFLVHRLVAIAFIPKVDGKEHINHIDGNPRNNHVENLEWCTNKENNNHGFDNGLMKCNFITYLINTRTNEVIRFRSMAQASSYLGFNRGYISGVLKKGRTRVKEYKIYTRSVFEDKSCEIEKIV